ncbi:MAG: YcgN family cysteine cluster protein [Hyphomicrobiaceae bacterium]|nr:YcgN family cysteine cluster protein [Hyphomicrobiaceae bacterium]
MTAFWEIKTLEEMSPEEWESLCDGCGRCCLLKLEDEDTGETYTSNVRCKLLNGHTCRCTDYANRQDLVPDCIRLDPEAVRTLGWIPKTCAYRRVAEGRGLAWWHPLVSGTKQTVIDAGISVRSRTVSETEVKPGEWEDHVAEWPSFDPDE